MAELVSRDGMTPSAHPTGLSIGLGVALIVVGVVALAAPLFAGIATSIFIGWLVLFGGVAHLAYSWSERGTGAMVVQGLIGLVYLAAAFYLMARPLNGVRTLTFILAIYIGIEGVLEVAIYFRLRRTHGGGFFLLDGAISIFLAALILAHWPSSSAWALGTLVGVSLIFSGIARFSLPTGRRRRALLPI